MAVDGQCRAALPEHANAQDAMPGYLGQHNSVESSAQPFLGGNRDRFFLSSDETSQVSNSLVHSPRCRAHLAFSPLDDEHYWLCLQGVLEENRVIPTGVYYNMNLLLVQLFTAHLNVCLGTTWADSARSARSRRRGPRRAPLAGRLPRPVHRHACFRNEEY